ncbi:MAG: helix-turn-helix domain-containing protein [Deltaproteobacteria bacterium]|nr:helix-turn-helix domain-containing protein [Deltaproteobacteria bacterium]
MEINYSDIIERMKDAARLRNDSAVARVLGVTPQALSNYKKRGKMPTNLVIKFAAAYGLSVDWLLTGRGNMVRQGVSGKKGHMAVEEEVLSYGKEAEAGLENILELAPLNPDEIIYVGKLLKVLRKGNRSTATILKSSIEAFLKAVESSEKEGAKKAEQCKQPKEE